MVGLRRSLLVLSLVMVLFGWSPSSADIPVRPRFPNPLEILPRIPNPFGDNVAGREQPAGGVVAPKSPSHAIRLQLEKVTIQLEEDLYEVAADFDFFNTGELDILSVGLPRREATRTDGKLAEFRNFHAWVQGHIASFHEESGFFSTVKRLLSRIFGPPPKGDGLWLVCQVRFPRHENTTVSTIYSAGYNSSDAGREARYLIGYGSFWKDSITKAVFTIDGKKIGGTKNFEVFLPKAHKPTLTTENAVTFEMEDWEPEPQHQLMIVIKPHEPEKRLEISW